jgi:YHS domain-containing protein
VLDAAVTPFDAGARRKRIRPADFGLFSSHFRYLRASSWLVAGIVWIHAQARTVLSPPPKGDAIMQNFSRRTTLRLGLLATLSVAAPLPSTAMDMPLAIQGYDPVAYFTDGKPIRGMADFEYQWDEHTYRFASDQHRELFKADPVHYAPQFGNYCAMALALGKIVKADPENWLISDNKLYVFGSPAPKGPELFQKDLAGNIIKANQNRSILPKDSN